MNLHNNIFSDLPNTPENISINNVSGSSFIRWNLPEDEDTLSVYPLVSSFVIEVNHPDRGNWKKIGEVEGRTRSFEIPKSLYGDEYLVRITSKNEAGLSKKPLETPEPVKFEKIKG